MEGNLGRVWKEAVDACLRYLSGIHLEGLRKTVHGNRPAGRDSDSGLSDYKVGALIVIPRRSTNQDRYPVTVYDAFLLAELNFVIGLCLAATLNVTDSWPTERERP
jgi:hypothetical protein